MKKPERVNIDVKSEQLRELAYECIAQQKENPDLLIGITAELMLAIAEKIEELEDAHAAADTAIFDEEFHIPEGSEPN